MKLRLSKNEVCVLLTAMLLERTAGLHVQNSSVHSSQHLLTHAYSLI